MVKETHARVISRGQRSDRLRAGGSRPRPRPPLRASFIALILGVLIPGCGGGDDPSADAFELRHEDGVEVALSRVEGADTPRRRLADETPLARIGSEAEGSPALFGQPNQVAIDGRERLWVVDFMARELRIFRLPGGEHLATHGGPGDGPGEFQRPTLLGLDAEDQAWIWDDANGRLTVVTAEGAITRERRVGEDRELIPRLRHVAAGSGALWAQFPQRFQGSITDGMVLHDTIRVWRMEDADAEPVLVAEREGPRWWFEGGIQAPIPFREGARFSVREDRLAMTDGGGAPRIEIVDARGRIVRRIMVDRPRVPVTPAAVERDLAGPSRTDRAAELLRSRRAGLPVPDHVPAWDWVHLGPDGSVHARRHGTMESGEAWDVFDPDGRLVEVLELAPGEHLVAVEHGTLVLMELPETAGPRLVVHARNAASGGR